MGVIDDARGMSRCSASAIPTGGVRRVQTPSDCQRDFENGALERQRQLRLRRTLHEPGDPDAQQAHGPLRW
jgi:hypothetical protein